MNTNDLNRLGTSYKIVDKEGSAAKVVRIVNADDILSAALGEYSDIIYLNFEDYLKQSNEMVTGFNQDPLKVYWHTCTKFDYKLTDIIEVCVTEDYEVAIIEIIADNLLDFYSE